MIAYLAFNYCINTYVYTFSENEEIPDFEFKLDVIDLRDNTNSFENEFEIIE